MKEYNTVFYPRMKGNAKYGNPRLILQTICEIVVFWHRWIILGERTKNKNV
jgi:hypothetical protein